MLSNFTKLQQKVVGFFGQKGANSRLLFKNPIKVEHWRNGKCIAIYETFNDITNEGKNLLFDVMFNDVAHIANNSWFLGLISSVSFSALANSDVMSSHAGWTEFVGYTESTRVPWGSGAASGQAVVNAVPIQFDFNAGGTVKGVFISTNSTKAGTSGKLWATALFSTDVIVVNGDQLKVIYTVSA